MHIAIADRPRLVRGHIEFTNHAGPYFVRFQRGKSGLEHSFIARSFEAAIRAIKGKKK